MDDNQLKEKIGSHRDAGSINLPGNASNVANIESKDLPQFLSNQDQSQGLSQGQNLQSGSRGSDEDFGYANLKNATFNQGRNDDNLLGGKK